MDNAKMKRPIENYPILDLIDLVVPRATVVIIAGLVFVYVWHHL